jgi:hypothetical protein
MSIAGKSLDSHKGHERKVSKTVALAVIAKLKAGKSSVMAEARRLGVYHATLRKEMRAAVGSKLFERLMRAKTGRRKPRLYPATSTGPKHASQPKPRPASRPAPSVTTPPASMPAERYPSGRKRYPKQTPPTFSHVAGDFYCGRCGSDHLKTGTDGNGGGILWCVCGWTRAIPRVRATAATLADSGCRRP